MGWGLDMHISKPTAIILIVGLIFFAIIAWLADWAQEHECPRMILGYNCKGDTCDHSEKARDEAWRAVRMRQF